MSNLIIIEDYIASLLWVGGPGPQHISLAIIGASGCLFVVKIQHLLTCLSICLNKRLISGV